MSDALILPIRTRRDYALGAAHSLASPTTPAATKTPSASPPFNRNRRAPEPLEIIDPTTLAGVPVPEREWIVPDWLPIGHVTLHYADGAVGKTLLAQQLCTSCATGVAWCGLQPTKCRSIGFYCEDTKDELHRRQDDINARYGVTYGDLGATRWISRVGMDNVLMNFFHGIMIRTPFLEQVQTAAINFRARLIVVDTAADCFNGDENNRSQVRQFIGLLNGVAQAINGAVLLNAHPSRSGLSATGDVDGGSTAWNNSARSRWSMERPKGEDISADTNERVLTRRKANYASRGEKIKLRWTNGVLIPEADISGIVDGVAMSREQSCEERFLAMLDAHYVAQPEAPLSPSNKATFFAPRLFAERSDAGGFSRRDLERAMSRLMEKRTLTTQGVGRARDGRQKLIRVSSDAPSDDGGGGE
jgi:RecA-family ATPase